MRVIHVLDELNHGGAQRVVLGLARWFADHGHATLVVGLPGTLSADAETSAEVAHPRSGSFLALLIRLFQSVREFRPDVIHAHQRREALVAVLVGWACGVTVVEHAHTELPSASLRWLSFRSRRIFAVSEDVRNMLMNRFGVPAHKIELVFNTSRYGGLQGVKPPSVGEDGAGLEVGAGQSVVLGVGRLAEQKDPQRFIDIVGMLAKTVPVIGVWVGDGPLRETCEVRIASSSAPVQLVGFQDDVRSYMSQADLLLLTSRWEGLPLVVLEAMTLELPVAAPRVGGIEGALGSSRGFVYDFSTDDAVVSSELAGLLADRPRLRSMSSSAKSYANEVYSSDEVYGRVLAAYQSLGIK